MKKPIFLIIVIISHLFLIFWFLKKINNQVSNIDVLNDSLKKIDSLVPKSDDIYFISHINDISQTKEIYFKIQFVLTPRIIISEEFKNVPEKSYLIVLQEEEDINLYNLNTILISQDLQTLFPNKKHRIFLFKKIP